jgi:hypothetical protein
MDPHPDPAILVTDQHNYLFFIFLLITFEGTFTSFFKDKKSKRSHKTVIIKGFLTVLLDDRRMIEGSGSGSTPLTNGSGSGRPKTCGSGTLKKIQCS